MKVFNVERLTGPLAMIVMFLVLIAPAASGQFVDGFDPSANNGVDVIVVQPDGKILIGGDFTALSPNGGAAVARNYIARLNPDGTLDAAFNPNASDPVRSIAIQADGKILVGGFFFNIGGQARGGFARLDATTGLADSFNPTSNFAVLSIVVQTDTRILVGGQFTSIGGQTRNRIARLDPATGLADSFDPNADSVVYSLAIQVDGKILAGGNFTNVGGQTRNNLARLDATTGAPDSFDPNPNGQVSSIALQADGKIVAGGQFTSIGGQTRLKIARLDAGTGLADSLDPSVTFGNVISLAVQADGKILAGGDFTNVKGLSRRHIARFDATTGLADSFDPNTSHSVYAIAVQADGGILVGGVFITLSPNGGAPVTRNAIARLTDAPVITSPLVAAGTVGLPFTYQMTASGTTSLGASNLPPGLTFNTNLAAIIGTPTTPGMFQVALSAMSSSGTTNATLSLTVQPVPTSGPVIASGTAATGRVGQPFRFQVYTTGGTSGARVSATGLPLGLSVDAVTGRISGTPAIEGSSAVSLTVTDGAFTANSIVQLTFTADPALPVITSSGSASLTTGEFFTYTILAPSSADPSTDPTTFTVVGTLPMGLSFDGINTISGIYIGPFLREDAGGRPRQPALAGGTIGSIQLFGTNSHGSSTLPLVFGVASSGVVNISTRLLIQTGDNVLIGGFIITGDAPKVVIIRGLGPSTGVPGALQDPTLELHDSAGHPPVLNDNWRDTQEQIIRDTGISPADDHESAIVAALDPGPYTAIVAGKNGATGVGLVEVYDLGTASVNTSSVAQLVQISTRGFVETGNNVLIGGFIIRSQPTRVIVRAIGPSLSGTVLGALQDTTLELHDGSGSLIASNDDWRSDQEQEIIATGVPPTDNHESAIVATLSPGPYSAIVRGKDNTTGVALVEVYTLQ